MRRGLIACRVLCLSRFCLRLGAFGHICRCLIIGRLRSFRRQLGKVIGIVGNGLRSRNIGQRIGVVRNCIASGGGKELRGLGHGVKIRPFECRLLLNRFNMLQRHGNISGLRLLLGGGLVELLHNIVQIIV